MTSLVTVRHNWETGHRLPHLPGKCQSLHGHSWWGEVTVAGEVDDNGVLVEFGAFKAQLREWIDLRWDHGLILGSADPLVPVLINHGKVYVMDAWPTVENVASHLAGITMGVIIAMGGDPAMVVRVDVTETHVNRASWVRT